MHFMKIFRAQIKLITAWRIPLRSRIITNRYLVQKLQTLQAGIKIVTLQCFDPAIPDRDLDVWNKLGGELKYWIKH
jgi:hypothetical protein